MNSFVLIPALALLEVASLLWTIWLVGFAARKGRRLSYFHRDHPWACWVQQASFGQKMGVLAGLAAAMLAGLGLYGKGLLTFVPNPWPLGTFLMVVGPSLVIGSAGVIAFLFEAENRAEHERGPPERGPGTTTPSPRQVEQDPPHLLPPSKTSS